MQLNDESKRAAIQDTVRMLSEKYPEKSFLTVEEIAQLIECSPKTVYNWTKRPDPSRRPPRITLGKSLRFPKHAFLDWLFTNEMV